MYKVINTNAAGYRAQVYQIIRETLDSYFERWDERRKNGTAEFRDDDGYLEYQKNKQERYRSKSYFRDLLVGNERQ